MAEQKYMDPARLRTSRALKKRLDDYLAASSLTPDQQAVVRQYALGMVPWRSKADYYNTTADMASELAKHVFSVRPPTAQEVALFNDRKRSPAGAVGHAPISVVVDGKTINLPAGSFPGAGLSVRKYWNPEDTWAGVAESDRQGFMKEYEGEVNSEEASRKIREATDDPNFGGAAPAGVDAGPPPMQLIGMPPSYGGASGRFPRAQESPQEKMRRRFEEELSQLSEADQAMRRGVAPGGVRFDNVAGIPTPRGQLDENQKRAFIDWTAQTFGDEKAGEVSRRLRPPAVRLENDPTMERLAKLREQAAQERESRGMGRPEVGQPTALSDLMARKLGMGGDDFSQNEGRSAQAAGMIGMLAGASPLAGSQALAQAEAGKPAALRLPQLGVSTPRPPAVPGRPDLLGLGEVVAKQSERRQAQDAAAQSAQRARVWGIPQSARAQPPVPVAPPPEGPYAAPESVLTTSRGYGGEKQAEKEKLPMPEEQTEGISPEEFGQHMGMMKDLRPDLAAELDWTANDTGFYGENRRLWKPGQLTGPSDATDLAGALPAPSPGGRLESWRKLNEARRLRGEPPLPPPEGL